MKKVLLIGVLLVLLAVAGAGGFWFWQKQKVEAFSQAPFGDAAAKVVEIPQGSGPRKVATLLAQGGVVSDADLAYRLIRRDALGPKLRAGEYEFAGPLTPSQVLQRIASGQVKVYRFTVPEGLRVDEILPIVAASELKLDLQKLQALAQDTAFIRKAGVPVNELEGFLHPDTYTFTRGATEESVLTKMIGRTLEVYKEADAARKSGVKLGLMETLTLASIVEKETGAVEERPRISCVFHNRLRLKMKLQTDPTVLYAMSRLRGKWLNNITKADLTTDHPYNTYTRYGLPPGPIASPGSAAIQAALAPLECNDLFFVSRNDGTHIFCPDLGCHNAAVEQWQKQFFRAKRKATAAKKTRR